MNIEEGEMINNSKLKKYWLSHDRSHVIQNHKTNFFLNT